MLNDEKSKPATRKDEISARKDENTPCEKTPFEIYIMSFFRMAPFRLFTRRYFVMSSIRLALFRLFAAK